MTDNIDQISSDVAEVSYLSDEIEEFKGKQGINESNTFQTSDQSWIGYRHYEKSTYGTGSIHSSEEPDFDLDDLNEKEFLHLVVQVVDDEINEYVRSRSFNSDVQSEILEALRDREFIEQTGVKNVIEKEVEANISDLESEYGLDREINYTSCVRELESDIEAIQSQLSSQSEYFDSQLKSAKQQLRGEHGDVFDHIDNLQENQSEFDNELKRQRNIISSIQSIAEWRLKYEAIGGLGLGIAVILTGIATWFLFQNVLETSVRAILSSGIIISGIGTMIAAGLDLNE